MVCCSGGTPDVEVIGMLVRNFFGKPLKYPDFDFKHLKIPRLLAQYPKKCRVFFPSAKRHALQKTRIKISHIEQPDYSLRNNFIQFTENFSETSFLLDMENEQTLKIPVFCFCTKFSRNFPDLKILKSDFYTLKNTTSIPITLLCKCAS